jgi:uncharacterized membrane protein
MARRRTIGNIIAGPRFLAFIAALTIAVPLAIALLDDWALGAMAGFDAAAALFLLLCMPLLRTRDAATIEAHAEANDANRTLLLAIAAVVVAVLLIAIATETVGRNAAPATKALIIVTLALAWLFINSLYALHYAHLAYARPGKGCAGIEFPGTREPVYWDFLYYAFTVGMTFQTSDVSVTDVRIRRVTVIHGLAAFTFNIGVLAFTINVLGR